MTQLYRPIYLGPMFVETRAKHSILIVLHFCKFKVFYQIIFGLKMNIFTLYVVKPAKTIITTISMCPCLTPITTRITYTRQGPSVIV